MEKKEVLELLSVFKHQAKRLTALARGKDDKKLGM